MLKGNGGFMLLSFHTWQWNYRACHVYHSLPELPCYRTDILICCLWVIHINTWATNGSGSAVGQPWGCETSNECLLCLYFVFGRDVLPPSSGWITLLWKYEKLWHEPKLKPVNVSCRSLRTEYWGDHLNCRRINWHEGMKINRRSFIILLL